MRGAIGIGGFALVVVGACGGESLPRTVDQRWVTRCQGSATNVYGMTRERACLAAAKGYEDADDPPRAQAYYKRACDLGYGDACVDWSRLLLARGNVTGARFVLSSSAACEDDKYAGKCGWALVGSLERDEPTRPSEVNAVLHAMCDRHHVASACKRLMLVGSEPSSAQVKEASADDAGAPGVHTSGMGVDPAGRPSSCHAQSDCVSFELVRDQGSCEGSLRVNVTNHCNERVYCAWCQSKGTDVLDRSTCGGHWFEVDQTYRGVVSFCDRAKRGDDVMYTCAAASDPGECTKL